MKSYQVRLLAGEMIAITTISCISVFIRTELEGIRLQNKVRKSVNALYFFLIFLLLPLDHQGLCGNHQMNHFTSKFTHEILGLFVCLFISF